MSAANCSNSQRKFFTWAITHKTDEGNHTDAEQDNN